MILNGNEQLLSACGQTSSSWLFLHLSYVCYITTLVLVPLVMPVVFLVQFRWTPHLFDDSPIEDFSAYERSDSRLDRFYQYVLFEVRLIAMYVSVAFVFRWLMNNQSIHWNEISRWFIEASMIPLTLMAIVAVHLGIADEYLCVLDLTFLSPFIYTIKAALFITVRYAELHPSSRFNDYYTLIFYCICDKFGFHQIPEHHRLRGLICRS